MVMCVWELGGGMRALYQGGIKERFCLLDLRDVTEVQRKEEDSRRRRRRTPKKSQIKPSPLAGMVTPRVTRL